MAAYKKSRISTKDSILVLISSVTGHKVEELDCDMYLESDLGLDSIKMISLMNEMLKIVPPEQIDDFTANHPVASLMALQTIGDIVELFENWQSSLNPTDESMTDRLADQDLNRFAHQEVAASSTVVPVQGLASNSMKASVIALIAGVTGHKEEDLDGDLYLESDLGLDSIKMISLMNELMKLIPAEQVADFTTQNPVASLMALQTVGDIVDLFEKWQQSLEVASDALVTDEPANLEMLHAQYPFLITYLSVANLSISSGVKVKGELDIRKLRDSWGELLSRHPALRAVFRVSEDAASFKGYSMELLKNVTPPEIPVQDIRHLDAQTQQQVIKQQFEAVLNEKFDIFQWPLHYFTVIRTADWEYEIFLAINHLVSDGLGNQQILRELLEIYGARSQGKQADLPKALSAEDYNRIVSDLNSWNSPEESAELERYLKQQGRDKYFFNPYGPSKKLASVPFTGAKIRTKKYWLDQNTTELLMSRTKSWRVSLFVLLVSAYLKTIKQQGETRNQMILNLPTGGKVYPNVDASDVLSSFAQNLALSFQCEDVNEGWNTLIRRTEEEITRNLSSGIDRAQIQKAAYYSLEKMDLQNGKIPETVASIIRSTLKSNLYLSFVGNTGIKKRYGEYEVSDYEAFTGTNPGTIDNLVELFHDKLMITSNYDAAFFDDAYIDEHMNRFIQNLKELAAFVVDPQKPLLQQKSASPQHQQLERQLSKLVEEICCRTVLPADLDKDLDAELGMDSLQRIRLITRLGKTVGNLDKQKLFGCRTLREMLFEIDRNDREEAVNTVQAVTEIPYLKIIEQCKATPEAIAILDQAGQITYRELEILSNKLAHYLRAQGVKAGSRIGIMTLPGRMMLMGILGILKSGAAYVPIDPTYPPNRIQYIVDHAKIEILLSEHSLMEQVGVLIQNGASIQKVVHLDSQDTISDLTSYHSVKQIEQDVWVKYPESDPEYINTPDDLMVVLYTSGSTGNPKGVMLNHRGYMNRLVWHQKVFQLQPGERVAQKTSCCFDISVWELLWPLMYGGTVCPIRQEVVKNPWSLAQWMKETRISVMHFVPSLFGEFVNALEEEEYTFTDLRWLIFSGEALPISYIQKWIDQYGMSTGLANLYGPTEASIDVTYHIIEKRPGSDGETSIPIGKPIDQVFIKNLDEQMRELPEGEMGELWIGGIQLAQGYLYNPEKTAEAFHPNPFPEIPGELLYRTGDLTVRKADGSYEYHGRIDNQVKIRGFRVELGEIEAVLSCQECVDEAAVIAVDYAPGQKVIIAWVSGKQIDDQELKAAIGQKLPHYMIPHRIEWLPKLPKNPNGKLDRKVLHERFANGQKETESSDHVKYGSPSVSKEPIVAGEQLLPLAPAQKWLMNYFEYPYCWTGFTRFVYKRPLDLPNFKKAVSLLINRHDALRSVLVQQDSKWAQRILTQDLASNVDFYDGTHMSEEQIDQAVQELITQTIQEFKVDVWPLWRMMVIQVSDSSYEIAAVGHHLISDVITNQLLFQEIWQIYGQLQSGATDIKLPQAKSFAEFVLSVEEEKQNHQEEFVNYWKTSFPPDAHTFAVPADFNLGPNDEGSAQMESFRLDKENTSSLLGKAKKYFESNVYPILLAPLYQMLGNLYHQSKVIVSHRVHGRDIGNQQLFLQTPGNFAVNFPLGVTLEQGAGWRTMVQQIRDGLEQVPLHGVSYDLVSENLPIYLYPDVKLTPIRANYLGNRDLPNLPDFKFSKQGVDRRFSLPQQKRISLIEFFFSIDDGHLQVEIEYSKNLYAAATIKRLGEQYLENMQKLLSSIQEPTSQPLLKPLTVSQIQPREGQLSDKVAIITGGGRGIGRSIAIAMAQEGANIAIVSRSEEQLQETAAEIRQLGAEPLVVPADVSDRRQVQAIVDKVIERFGKIDILVNSAGVTQIASLMEMNPDDWEKIVQINLFGTYHLCYAVIPHLIKQNQGKIINIGSDSSFIGYPLMSAYAVSKHGVLGLTRALSEELKPNNIQVNAICPALVDTDMAPAAFRSKAIPPSKVADSAVFLASAQSDYITGESIRIYGKQDMHWFGSQQVPMLKAILNKQH